jgi:hypothetical protein
MNIKMNLDRDRDLDNRILHKTVKQTLKSAYGAHFVIMLPLSIFKLRNHDSAVSILYGASLYYTAALR